VDIPLCGVGGEGASRGGRLCSWSLLEGHLALARAHTCARDVDFKLHPCPRCPTPLSPLPFRPPWATTCPSRSSAQPPTELRRGCWLRLRTSPTCTSRPTCNPEEDGRSGSSAAADIADPPRSSWGEGELGQVWLGCWPGGRQGSAGGTPTPIPPTADPSRLLQPPGPPRFPRSSRLPFFQPPMCQPSRLPHCRGHLPRSTPIHDPGSCRSRATLRPLPRTPPDSRSSLRRGFVPALRSASSHSLPSESLGARDGPVGCAHGQPARREGLAAATMTV
jgi:hypothetical protein